MGIHQPKLPVLGQSEPTTHLMQGKSAHLPLGDKSFGVTSGLCVGNPQPQGDPDTLTAQSRTVKHRVRAGDHPVAMGSPSQTESVSKRPSLASKDHKPGAMRECNFEAKYKQFENPPLYTCSFDHFWMLS